MIRTFLFAYIGLQCLLQVYAQMPEMSLNNDMKPPQIELEYEQGPLRIGSILFAKVRLDSGWHINANIPVDEFLVPSTVQASARGIAFGEPKWPKPYKEYIEALQIENLVFKDSFVVEIPIVALETERDSTTTNLVLDYQACSNFICLAPSKASASIGAPLQATPIKKKSSESGVGRSLFDLLLLAFLGGLILNLMPCVLPVLSLKALGLVRQAGESRGRLMALGASMTMGVLVSFWLLATMVVVTRAAGGHVGWGFQFQNPPFLVFMASILTLFAANLLGAFEFWIPSSANTGMYKAGSREGLGGAFLNGALMTLLSTPCSAPFLGTAMGFAFAQPSSMLFLFFSVAGLGLATPFLLITVFPKSMAWIPKPGDWMVAFKQFLGFLLLATAAWIAWVFGRSTGANAMGALLGLLLALGLFAWLMGRLAPPGAPFWKLLLMLIAGGLLAWAGWYYVVSPAVSADQKLYLQPTSGTVDADGWAHFTPALLENAHANGTTVFLDVTADWCITCKANEKAVLNRDTVRQAFKELDVLLVKADWTRQDADISRLLAHFRRGGVPLYVIYPGHSPKEPIVLPELITVGMILDSLEKAGPSR